jgi:hypothetical protein
VSKANSTTTLSSAPNPSGINQSVTLSAAVAAVPGLPAPTGEVQFKNGKQVLGTVTLSGGMASLNATFTATGSFTVKATYSGSKDYLGSSATLVQVVQ